MGEPRRIQLSRAKGWRLADHSTNCTIVDRRSIWGNHLNITRSGKQWIVLRDNLWPVVGTFDTNVEARAFAVKQQYRWLTDDEFAAQFPNLADARRWLLAHLDDLRGRDLACWCPLPAGGETDWCHARVLIELSNYRGVSS